ncbi:MAG: M48 family metallopeptidase [Prevotellaceae bacterium]|jgi:heat shock protein HtpX|nr:M48 family metallopeptidase [Prevotellaceae bacterium]
MKYVGIQTQKRVNNIKSTLLLILFPCIILFLVWLFFYILYGQISHNSTYDGISAANQMFVEALPWVVGGCLVWFLIAYFANTTIIQLSTGSHTLKRKDNKRVYNLVENLCIANNMSMPKINIIDDDSLNAFASGINKRTFTVTLSRGIINKLDDHELEGVIAHELTHIRNRDVKLLIVSIVFVGIFSFLTQMLLRTLLYGNHRSSSKDKGGGVVVIVIALVLAVIGYLITILMRFAISRKREYMADAGSAEMTKNPLALASALRKISTDSRIEAVTQKDVAQLFIDNPLQKGIAGLFSTHPPIEKRIKLLEQF